MQQVVCPSSFFHTRESLSSPFFGDLKKCNKLLSEGVKFHDSPTIQRFQLVQHARNWIEGNPDKPLQLKVRSVVSGDINSWPPDFHVNVNLNYGPEVVQDLVHWRDVAQKGLKEVFQGWQLEQDREFPDWFEEEALSFGKLYFQAYLDFAKESILALSGQQALKLPSERASAVHAVINTFLEIGYPRSRLF